MKIRIFVLLVLVMAGGSALSQTPQEIYRKPLKEVLTDISNK